MRKIANKKIAAVAAGVIVVASAGAAYAYWTTSGSGTGSGATSAGAENVTVTEIAAPTNMAPGLDAEDIEVDVTNNAENDAYVSQVVVTFGTVTGPNITAATPCTSADYTLSDATLTDAAGDLAEGATASFTGATLGFNNLPANQDGCKGATVNLVYTAS
jgi:hypothetical protein